MKQITPAAMRFIKMVLFGEIVIALFSVFILPKEEEATFCTVKLLLTSSLTFYLFNHESNYIIQRPESSLPQTKSPTFDDGGSYDAFKEEVQTQQKLGRYTVPYLLVDHWNNDGNVRLTYEGNYAGLLYDSWFHIDDLSEYVYADDDNRRNGMASVSICGKRYISICGGIHSWDIQYDFWEQGKSNKFYGTLSLTEKGFTLVTDEGQVQSYFKSDIVFDVNTLSEKSLWTKRTKNTRSQYPCFETSAIS